MQAGEVTGGFESSKAAGDFHFHLHHLQISEVVGEGDIEVLAKLVGSCDFGQGVKPTVQISWGDVSTAFRSTGIPNIEVQIEAIPILKALARLPRFVKSFLGLAFMQSFLKARVDRQPEGPSDEARRSAHGLLVGVASNERGESVRSRLTTPEGYTLTAMSAVDIAKRVASGDFEVGFQTPSLAYGADYILRFDRVKREDLNT